MIETVLLGSISLGAALWLGVLVLPWFPWLIRERLEPTELPHPPALSDVTAVIPARDEAAHITETLEALFGQGAGIRAVVVDDQSGDATAACVEAVARNHSRLELVRGTSPPEGWTGKLWALQQGVARVRTPWVLLLDADITLAPNMLPVVYEKCRAEEIAFFSIMARLRTASAWERLLMPAFVLFFKLLYPFALSNAGSRRVSAAAGGFILCRRACLEESGSFAALRGEIIDDCALAKRVRGTGARTWIGLSRGVLSRRAYPHLNDIWQMVARTAFNQLRYSVLLLLLATALLLAAFWAPILGIIAGPGAWPVAGGVALLAMVAVYLPTLAYYRLSVLWAVLLPLAGSLYLAMTWTSAIRYWRGETSRWKGRSYARSSRRRREERSSAS
ncbi:MAG: glycosyltransferase [Candidatus Binatia bacterium]